MTKAAVHSYSSAAPSLPDILATRCWIQIATITTARGQEQVWTVKQTMPVLVLESCGRKFVVGLN